MALKAYFSRILCLLLQYSRRTKGNAGERPGRHGMRDGETSREQYRLSKANNTAATSVPFFFAPLRAAADHSSAFRGKLMHAVHTVTLHNVRITKRQFCISLITTFFSLFFCSIIYSMLCIELQTVRRLNSIDNKNNAHKSSPTPPVGDTFLYRNPIFSLKKTDR